MIRKSETFVVDSESTSDSEETASSSKKSDLYIDTEVNQTERDVTFHNSAKFKDTSTAKRRRVRFRAHAEGNGVDTWGSWTDFFEYLSPLSEIVFECNVLITVPDNQSAYYEFVVITRIVVEKEVDNEWIELTDDDLGFITAKVNDDST